MREFIDSAINFLKDQVASNNPIIGIVVGMLVIVLESIIPILPLAVFIAVNMLVFGNILGFIISWVATVLGCLLAFYICRNKISKSFYKKIKDDGRINNIMKKISTLKFTNLVLITALPFTPAFLVNIAAGLSKISVRKFMFAIMIAKISIVYFWGFIGTTFLESITNIKVLIELGIIILIAYLVSRWVMKKFNLE